MSLKLLTYQQVHREVIRQGDRKRAAALRRFFKTGPGEYGEGDRFAGLTVPQLRGVAKGFSKLSFSDIKKLLLSKIHEERLLALLILVRRYEKNESERERIYRFYLANTASVNNWDLVDLSADKIVGRYLAGRSPAPLLKLACSKSLWERRIAVVATFQFIRRADFKPTLKIIGILMRDPHDLIHKACGWMLREIGKRDAGVLRDFLRLHHRIMPRTMLRYAIERFAPAERRRFLSGQKPDFTKGLFLV